MTFQELGLIEPILKALKEEGYQTPTPIQEKAIPHALSKRDVLGCAQTGTGKTAAFALPVLQNLHRQQPPQSKNRKIKTLTLTPTRELAIQIADSFKSYSRHLDIRGTVIFGGVPQKPQEVKLRRGIDVLVATPGRLLDLMNQGIVDLSDVEIFILDEADRMLDMGFIHDVRRIIKALPSQRHTMFFSATMPNEIAKLAQEILTDPIKVAVTPISSTAEKIEQSIYFVEKKKKRHLLAHLMENPAITSALVFTRTKHGANRVARDLDRVGVDALAIHGNKSQTARQKALSNFKEGKIRVLVATDIAARGIDVEELTHVINFDIPNIPETYVHRIGRTGRAGASGIALSFCDVEEMPYLKDIQKLIGLKVPIESNHPFHYDPNNPPEPAPKAERPQREGRGGHDRRGKPKKGKFQHQPKRQKVDSTDERNDRPVEGKGGQSQPSRNSKDNRRRPDGRNRQRDSAPHGEKESIKKPQDENKETSTEDKNDDGKWSSSIFGKPNAGKKGFVIKSDRYDKPKGKSGRRPNRGGKR